MKISMAETIVGVLPLSRSCADVRTTQSQPPSGIPSAGSSSHRIGTEWALATGRPVAWSDWYRRIFAELGP